MCRVGLRGNTLGWRHHIAVVVYLLMERLRGLTHSHRVILLHRKLMRPWHLIGVSLLNIIALKCLWVLIHHHTANSLLILILNW